MAQQRRAAPKLAKAGFAEEATSDAWAKIPRTPQKKSTANLGGEEEVLPAKGPARTTTAFSEVRPSLPCSMSACETSLTFAPETGL